MRAAILAILVFGFLILVHELGHFWAAKRAKVRVNEFWIGMGPAVFKKKYGDTEYSLRAFPIGGAVVMEGEDSESDSSDSFQRARIGQRAFIISAGALMNFITGIIIILILVIPMDTMVTSTIESFGEGFKYSGPSGLMVGDEILNINGYSILTNADITVALNRYSNEAYDIVVKRDGERYKINDLPMAPQTFIDDGQEVMRYGLTFASQPAGILDRIRETFAISVNFARMVWYSLFDLFTGQIGADQLSGPIGVSVILEETASYSISSMLMLVAFISINLGVMNLLPLPALDGGRLLFILLEFLRGGKPVPAKYEGYVHGTGFVLLMILTVYITFNDIIKLINIPSLG